MRLPYFEVEPNKSQNDFKRKCNKKYKADIRQQRRSPGKNIYKKKIAEKQNISYVNIDEAVKNGVRDFEDLQFKTKISTVCGQCKDEAEEYLHQSIHLYGDE